MSRPDFTKKWASSRPSIPVIASPDYAQGFANYLGAIPPSTDDHDYIMNLQDERAVWLANSQLDSLRLNVASAGTVNLATLAPDTRNINITGTTTITAFTVAAGQTYFVRFAGALTLTNNSGIVTQSGANITTAAGDTCIIRATAANVVEVLSYTPAGGWANSLAANGYQKLPSGLIIQWGAPGVTNAASGTIMVTLPIAFPNATLQAVAVDRSSEASKSVWGIDSFTSTQLSLNWQRVVATNVTGPRWVAIGY